jgi:hypothetical protein
MVKARPAHLLVVFLEDFLSLILLLALFVALLTVVRSCAPPKGELFAPERTERTTGPAIPPS